MKKIYFACSIRGGRQNSAIYKEIVEYLKTKTTVLTEIFADDKLTPDGMNKPSDEIWQIDTDWIIQADALIAEVSSPSLGVGYEIAFAENLNKPILALYKKDQDGKLSAMIEGSPKTTTKHYSDLDEAKKLIDEFLKSAN